MVRTCQECGKEYDDARHYTFCPHDRVMSEEALDRKIAGLKLIGKRIAFAHDTTETYRVLAVSWDGMVTIEGMAGEFAPHLFVIIGE